MSEKYFIEWTISGIAEITADSREEAREKFERLHIGDIASDGTLEVLSNPHTKAEVEADRIERRARWEDMLDLHPKTEAANG